MNGEYEYQDDGTKKRNLIIGIAVGVVVLAGVVTALVLFLRSRAGTGEGPPPPAVNVPANGNVNVNVNEPPPPPGPAANASPYPPGTLGEEKVMTAEMKRSLNFSADQEIRYRELTPEDPDDPSLVTTTGPIIVVTSVPPDPPDADHDGLSDDEEARRGTDPNDPDSDKDGSFDGDEVKGWGTDPSKAEDRPRK